MSWDTQADVAMRDCGRELQRARTAVIADDFPTCFALRKSRQDMNADSVDFRAIEGGFDRRMIGRTEVECGDTFAVAVDARAGIIEDTHGRCAEDVEGKAIADRIDVADASAHHGRIAGGRRGQQKKRPRGRNLRSGEPVGSGTRSMRGCNSAEHNNRKETNHFLYPSVRFRQVG